MKNRILLLSLLIQLSIVAKSQEVSNRELFGKVEVGRGKYKRIIDFDFPVIYLKDTCNNGLGKQLDFWLDNDSLNYTAPKFKNTKKGFLHYLSNEVIYPKYARENGLMGKVYVHFEISEVGLIENIWITKGVDISLDKEAFRVIKNLQLMTPPLLNGKSIRLCLDTPIVFQLSE